MEVSAFFINVETWIFHLKAANTDPLTTVHRKKTDPEGGHHMQFEMCQRKLSKGKTQAFLPSFVFPYLKKFYKK